MRTPLLHRVPLGLAVLRGMLGPVVAALALWWPDAKALAACLIAALLSDYFDGVIARRLGVATPGLRRLDSIADTVFYVAALFAAWHLHADLLRPHAPWLGALLALELLRYVVDFRKFGKEASYHMWSSKCWGLTLFIGFYAVLVHGEGGWPVMLALAMGVVADLEGLAISTLLPEWRHDVPTVFHALAIRRGLMSP